MTTFADAFDLLLDAYDREGSAGQARVYADVLDDQPIELVFLAAQSWVRSEDRMPTPHQLLTRTRELKAADRVVPQQAPPVEAQMSVAKLMIQATRQALKDVNLPPHQHGPGQTCPVCSRRDYWADAIEERTAIIMDEAPDPDEDADRLYECRDCWDEHWIVTSPGGDTQRDTFKPCPTCRPELHQKWAEGHFAPNHFCRECELARRSR